MATYNIVSVRRTPQAATSPVYTELGPLAASSITITDFLSAKPDEASFTVNLDAIDSDTKTALRDLAAIPLEVWVYRDGTRIFAGPVVGGTIQGNNIKLTCRGYLIYLSYMILTDNLSVTAQDMFTTAKGMVDTYQALSYGDFGVDTTGIGTLGTTRTAAWEGRTEHPRVLESIAEFAKGSFDFWVDEADGSLNMAAARGTDLTATVVIERGIADSRAGFALGPGLLASEVYATGTNPNGGIPLTTSKSDATLRASFGRASIGTSHDPVIDSSHLSDLAQGDLDELGTVYFNPGGELFEVQEADYGDLQPGNTVEYSYDPGLGKITQNVRIVKRKLKAGNDGTDKMSVEFE